MSQATVDRALAMRGIECVPAGWTAVPLKTFLRTRTERDNSELQLLSVYRDHGVVPFGSIEGNHNKPSLDLSAYKTVREGDLVLNKMKTWQGSLAISDYEGVVSPAYVVCKVSGDWDRRYLHHLLRSPSFVAEYASLSYGIRVNQWDMRFEDFREVVALHPPIDVQHRIVDYLDAETVRIDSLIGRKQRFVDLLLEKRTALVTRAVTQGLDPRVGMKDSGVEWIGSIPTTWSAIQLGQLLTRITYGFTNPMPVADDGPCMLTANDIGDGRVLYESARRTTEAAFHGDLTDKSRPRPGDILLTKDGSLGRTAIAGDTPACINQSVAILRVDPVKASNEFVQMALSAHNYQDRMILEAGGTAIKHIYITRLAKMPVALPPLNEQDEIVAATRVETRKIDALVERTRTSIDLLREYRTALISAAVTGQIDIPGTETTEEVA